MKICHIITGLDTGGAEMMLLKLLSRTDTNRFEPLVVSLTDRGTLAERIESLGISVITLGMKPVLPSPLAFGRCLSALRKLKPDILQGWMNHGNLASQLAAMLLSCRIPVVWNIRQAIYSLTYEKKSTAMLIRLGKYWSHLPAAIIYNSRIGAEQHEALGYKKSQRIIIPNGFDIHLFKPDELAAMKVRAGLKIPNDSIVIGMIGRYHPMKDHTTFLKAAAILSRTHPKTHFILAGDQVDHSNRELQRQLTVLNISGNVHMLGARNDIHQLDAAMDIASSSSFTEAFPNAVGEAMSCGVPCVVTNVGDSSWIVGSAGKVVPPRDPEALANGWRELIDIGPEQRKALGYAARQRVVQYFSLKVVVRQYEALYQRIFSAYQANNAFSQ